ncbi:hypothetical protein IWQ56_003634 [Coemansia nantahalensis]|nr:hypothetical protein IWQ56_003634 [Coemansia nantahalensis]
MASTTGSNLVRRPDPYNGSGDVRMWIRSMLHYVCSANPAAEDVDVRLLVNATIGNVTGAAEARVDTQRDENCALLTTSKEFIDGLGKQFEPFDRAAQAENEQEPAVQTTSCGHVYVLIMVDVFTPYMWLAPLPDKSALTVARALAHIFCAFGFPRIRQADLS